MSWVNEAKFHAIKHWNLFRYACEKEDIDIECLNEEMTDELIENISRITDPDWLSPSKGLLDKAKDLVSKMKGK